MLFEANVTWMSFSKQQCVHCILHNLLIDHAILQDWMVDNMESEEEEEAEDDSGGADHREQVLAYMMEMF